MTTREQTRKIRIGDVTIGGGMPVAIQSMTNTRTADVEATIAQILRLEEAGCEIIRCAVPHREDAEALRAIRQKIHIPLVADIHFDYRLAIAAIEAGADKIRINPGNIGSEDRVREVVLAAKARNIPIRVGVNSGSLEKEYLERDGHVTAEGIVDSALAKVQAIEKFGYENIVISIKSTDVPLTVRAHEMLAGRTDYPLHVGITESGTVEEGTVKSAVGIGAILSRGIGDTIRVSLTGDPVEEVYAAKRILRALHLRNEGVEVISCPTCGRTEIDLISLARAVTEMVRPIKKHLKVAVMGCIVNGPGEAKEADLGIAGGRGEGVLIRRGEVIRKMPENELLPALMQEIEDWTE